MRLSMPFGAPAAPGLVNRQLVSAQGGYALSGQPATLTYVPNQVSTGWPDNTNTGYLNAPGFPGALTNSTTGTFSGTQTVSFKDFVDVGPATTGSNCNVTFIGCRFQSNSVDFANVFLQHTTGTVRFQYCSFTPRVSLVTAPPNYVWPCAGWGTLVDGSGSAARNVYQIDYGKGYEFGITKNGSGAAAFEMTNCDMWGFGNAVDFKNGQGNALIRDCYFHDAMWEGPNVEIHTDGPGYLDGFGGPSNITIDHCTIASLGNTNGIAFQAATSGYQQIVVNNCYLGGFGYTVDMCHGTSFSSNLKFTNNVIDADVRYHHGFMYPGLGNSFGPSKNTNAWFNNKIVNTRSTYTGPESNISTSPADNGKFIWPDGTKSTTDFVDGVP
jgi:hypothetical protein